MMKKIIGTLIASLLGAIALAPLANIVDYFIADSEGAFFSLFLMFLIYISILSVGGMMLMYKIKNVWVFIGIISLLPTLLLLVLPSLFEGIQLGKWGFVALISFSIYSAFSAKDNWLNNHLEAHSGIDKEVLDGMN